MASSDDDSMPVGFGAARRRVAEKQPQAKQSAKKRREGASSSTDLPRSASLNREPVRQGPSESLAEHLQVIQLLEAFSSKTVAPKTCPMPHVGIRVGSACSGWASELWALHNLNVPHTCCFASDNDSACQALLRSMHDHHTFYQNVMSSEFSTAPLVDLFFSGFPCQSFSAAGLKRGLQDPEKGPIIFVLLLYISTRKPRWFCLENVEGLLKLHKETLALILLILDTLQDSNGCKLHLGILICISLFYVGV